MAVPIDDEALGAIRLTLELASLTTVLLLLIAIPLAWWLANTRSRWRAPIGAVGARPGPDRRRDLAGRCRWAQAADLAP